MGVPLTAGRRRDPYAVTQTGDGVRIVVGWTRNVARINPVAAARVSAAVGPAGPLNACWGVRRAPWGTTGPAKGTIGMIRTWAPGAGGAAAAAVRRAFVFVLPGLWVFGVVAWELCRPTSGRLLQLLAAAPAIACAGTGRRRCVLLGGVCALIALVPFGAVEPGAGAGTRVMTCGAILAVIGASYLTAGRRLRLVRELERTREVAVAAQRSGAAATAPAGRRGAAGGRPPLRERRGHGRRGSVRGRGDPARGAGGDRGRARARPGGDRHGRRDARQLPRSGARRTRTGRRAAEVGADAPAAPAGTGARGAAGGR